MRRCPPSTPLKPPTPQRRGFAPGLRTANKGKTPRKAHARHARTSPARSVRWLRSARDPPPPTYSCPYPCPYCILPCDVPGGRQMTLPPTRSVPSRGSRPHPRGCRRSRGSRSGRPALPGTLQPRHCRSRPPRPPPSRTKWTRLVHPSVLIGHDTAGLAAPGARGRCAPRPNGSQGRRRRRHAGTSPRLFPPAAPRRKQRGHA